MARGRRKASQTPLSLSASGTSRSRARPSRFTPTRTVSNRSTPASTKPPRKLKINKKPKIEWTSDDEEVKVETASEEESDEEYVHPPSDPESEEYDLTENEESNQGCSRIEEHKFHPWLDIPQDKLPLLSLPNTSTDLLVEPNLLFSALEVYEVCYNFYRVLQLSPFLFEDFCCALRSPDQSRLLSEIHIAFIRLFYRDDDDSVTYSAQDTNNYFNITLQLLDGMTYGEILRQYVESDPRFDQSILPILSENYPFVNSTKRLKVLKWLCDRFLETSIFRKVIRNEGKIVYDDVCRNCGKAGTVILCDGCDACYHVECTGMEMIPDGSWICSVCEAHDLSGATNLRRMGEAANRQPIKLSALGRDRHGRTYWFVARRIFVENINRTEVYYYSTLPQLYNLVKNMDSEYLEKDLCEAIKDNLDRIVSDMRMTLKLTNYHRDEIVKNLPTKKKVIPPSYLEQDNSFLMCQIMAELIQSAEDDPKVEHSMLVGDVLTALGFDDVNLVDTFWSGGSLSSDELISKHNDLVEALARDEIATLNEINTNNNRGYRYSFTDGHYREYINEYTTNELAKSSKQRNKEKDKRRYMSQRFSLMDEYEFVWSCPKNKDIYMNECYTGRNLQQSLLKFMDSLPDELYHRMWRAEKSIFMERMNKNYSNQPKDAEESKSMLMELRYLLLKFECVIRKPLFTNVWWNTLGITRLNRVTSDDKDRRTKLDLRQKKEEKALLATDPSDCPPDVKFVKYLKKQSQLWKSKNESYRLVSRGGMGGWLWVSCTLKRTYVSDIPVEERLQMHNKKKRSLENIVQKIKFPSTTADAVCYSHLCREYSKIEGIKYNCYSSYCPRKSARRVRFVTTDKPKPTKQKVLGENAPFPIPEPFQFKSRGSGKRSLMVLPQPHLRKLARQGGLNPTTVIFGFNKIAKTNSIVWHYPCPRPLFDHCWRYNTLNANSLHSLALSLRIMYSCVRWADLEPEDTKDSRVMTHHLDHDEVRQIVGHKEYPPDGYYERYKLKIFMLALEEDLVLPDDEGKGKKYKKKPPKKGQVPTPQMMAIRTRGETISWADGVDLKLYEIKSYWRRVLMEDETLKELQRRPVPVKSESRNSLPPPRPINVPPQRIMSSQKAQGLKSAFNAPVIARGVNRASTSYISQNDSYRREYTPSSLVVREPIGVRSNGTHYQSPSNSRDYSSSPVQSQQVRYVNTTPRNPPQTQNVRYFTPDTIVINSQGAQVNGYASMPRYQSVMRREPPGRRLFPNRQMYPISAKRVYSNGFNSGLGLNKENGRIVLDMPDDVDQTPPQKRIRLVKPEPPR
ncbi:unnamed protein product [Bursaphelenchus okinawaensis]|uniref:PHD-type domain-containing protein n=1 Tax=Bursaphelenchus okinawaensis TaxID=465554 RepID=A0A811K6F6_9BILA|nr:unnamed protein product [Bursaphelenchus okinawaensis]CAG9092517.1 unnamed protein product [Bursaphelenchus okinawaensis]